MTEFKKHFHLEIEQVEKDQKLDKPEDKFVVEFSDNEIQIVTRQQLEIWQKEAMKFNGFEGWIVKGKLISE